MHHSLTPPYIAVVAAVVALLLTTDRSQAQTATNAVQLQNGRLLAAACMQCHSSSGFDTIAGESVNEIISEFREMKKKRSPGIMELIARGYTDLQVKDIAAYLASLPKPYDDDDSEDDDD